MYHLHVSVASVTTLIKYKQTAKLHK